MKNKNIIIIIVIMLVLSIFSGSYYVVAKSRQNPKAETEVTATPEATSDSDVVDEETSTIDWSREYRVIAHALGGIDGYDYTNSLEAFQYNYDHGTRVFEIDLETTLDGDICLTHTWEDFRYKLTDLGGDKDEQLSTEEFMNTKIHGKYTTMLFKDILALMQKYKDFYVVIDSKMFDAEGTRWIYDKMIEEINSVNPELINRIVPQAYNPEIIDILQNEYKFPEIIYTLYSIYDKTDGEKIYQTVKDKGIRIVVMHMDNDWAEKVIKSVVDYAILDNDRRWQFNVYIHTINDINSAKEIVNDYHFFGIYSDDITEDMFRSDILNQNVKTEAN